MKRVNDYKKISESKKKQAIMQRRTDSKNNDNSKNQDTTLQDFFNKDLFDYIKDGNLEGVKIRTINHNKHAKMRNGEGHTPLSLAFQEGKAEILRHLLFINKDIKDMKDSTDFSEQIHNLIDLAMQTGRTEMLELLLEAEDHFKNESTPLQLAIKKNRIDILKALLEHGADVKVQNNSGDTPLHFAVSLNKIDTFKVLLEHGADINAKNAEGKTPLHLAALNHIIDPVKILLEHGADINAKNAEGKTPLYLATSRNSIDILKVLLEHGADINAKNAEGETPLHLATSRDSIVTLKVLLEHGADVNAKNAEGKTPLHLAALDNIIDAVKILLEHGADVNAKNAEEKTPLHLAASPNKIDLVKILLEHGADVNAKNAEGETPLNIAINLNDIRLVKILLHGDCNIEEGYKGDNTLIKSLFTIASGVKKIHSKKDISSEEIKQMTTQSNFSLRLLTNCLDKENLPSHQYNQFKDHIKSLESLMPSLLMQSFLNAITAKQAIIEKLEVIESMLISHVHSIDVTLYEAAMGQINKNVSKESVATQKYWEFWENPENDQYKTPGNFLLHLMNSSSDNDNNISKLVKLMLQSLLLTLRLKHEESEQKTAAQGKDADKVVNINPLRLKHEESEQKTTAQGKDADKVVNINPLQEAVDYILTLGKEFLPQKIKEALGNTIKQYNYYSQNPDMMIISLDENVTHNPSEEVCQQTDNSLPLLGENIHEAHLGD